MNWELKLTGDSIEELNRIVASLGSETDVDVDVTSDADEERGKVENLSEEQKYVLEALRELPDGGALRVVHRLAAEDNESPFDDYDSDDGWNEERKTVRSHLQALQRKGLVEREKQTWMATGRAESDD